MIGREKIARLVPHAEAMCLLDAVTAWDDARIVCRSDSHRDRAHPLRRSGRLGAVHLLEYAAQAMAVHGALLDESSSSRRVVAAMRDVTLHVDALDGVDGPLEIEAVRLVRMGQDVLYAVEVRAGGACLADGRVSVIATTEEHG